MDVYFDNNILSDLQARRGISDDEFARLRAVTKDGKITPKLSFVNIDEILAALVNHRHLALELLRLVADLFGLQTMIKPPHELLTHHFVDLAFGFPLRQSEVRMPVVIRQHLEQLLVADEGEVADFVEAAMEARDQIDDLWEKMRRAREQSRAELGPRYRAEPFGQYWREIAPTLVEAYASEVGVWGKFQDVEIEKLLANPSIGMMVGANASMIYARVVEGRRADRGDSRDQQHALMASTVDMFVTNDMELRRILQRVPLIAPAVIDLNQFLISIGARKG